jgi:hypothetical protein
MKMRGQGHFGNRFLRARLGSGPGVFASEIRVYLCLLVTNKLVDILGNIKRTTAEAAAAS